MTSLEYDGGGRRLVQHYDPKNGGGGVDKRDEYVFDGLDPVAEYDKLNGQRTDYYRGEGGDIALMHQYKGGTQGQMYWYHYNNKKDVVGLTKQNGNSHHNYRYEPYGAVLPENGNFTDPHNHYTLTGKEFDENTGLVWFGARHYEPETGVWMGQDVYRGRLSQPMSLHRFGYVNNNPITHIDLYGFEDHSWPETGRVIVHEDYDKTIRAVAFGDSTIYEIKPGESSYYDLDLDFVEVDGVWYKISIWNFDVGENGEPDDGFRVADEGEMNDINRILTGELKREQLKQEIRGELKQENCNELDKATGQVATFAPGIWGYLKILFTGKLSP